MISPLGKGSSRKIEDSSAARKEAADGAPKACHLPLAFRDTRMVPRSFCCTSEDRLSLISLRQRGASAQESPGHNFVVFLRHSMYCSGVLKACMPAVADRVQLGVHLCSALSNFVRWPGQLTVR